MNDCVMVPPTPPCSLLCPKRSAICHSGGVCSAWDIYQADYTKYLKRREDVLNARQAVYGYDRCVSRRCERMSHKRMRGNRGADV